MSKENVEIVLHAVDGDVGDRDLVV